MLRIYTAPSAATDTIETEPLKSQFSSVLGLALPADSIIVDEIPPQVDDTPDSAVWTSNLFGITPISCPLPLDCPRAPGERRRPLCAWNRATSCYARPGPVENRIRRALRTLSLGSAVLEDRGARNHRLHEYLVYAEPPGVCAGQAVSTTVRCSTLASMSSSRLRMLSMLSTARSASSRPRTICVCLPFVICWTVFLTGLLQIT